MAKSEFSNPRSSWANPINKDLGYLDDSNGDRVTKYMRFVNPGNSDKPTVISMYVEASPKRRDGTLTHTTTLVTIKEAIDPKTNELFVIERTPLHSEPLKNNTIVSLNMAEEFYQRRLSGKAESETDGTI